MIARQVLGAVGTVVDWSLIHLLGALSDRVEGRRADSYRRADQLADMEAGVEVWEPRVYTPTPPKHGLTCRSCEGDIATCGCWDDEEGVGRSAAVTVPAADNTTTDCGCGSTQCPDSGVVDSTDLLDHLVALWDYHLMTFTHPTGRGCEGCAWTGGSSRDHHLHRLALLADMTAATNRVTGRLDGAS